ncbi:hypothetical protein TcCL_NonESM11920 [Trypanosoma cruzi]|nr:hypothetical protein TcCL_NonESM11920 [Trypanosoma cruzi]
MSFVEFRSAPLCGAGLVSEPTVVSRAASSSFEVSRIFFTAGLRYMGRHIFTLSRKWIALPQLAHSGLVLRRPRFTITSRLFFRHHLLFSFFSSFVVEEI